jgi:hypothetical protein
MSVFWATVIGAGIGAAGAILGGFAAAWWQTSRADDVAQKIRAAERREEALIALRVKVTALKVGVQSLLSAAEEDPEHSQSQYEQAVSLVRNFKKFWEERCAGRIPDQRVWYPYTFLYITVLREGPAEFDLRPESPPTGSVQDLEQVLNLVTKLDTAVMYRLTDFIQQRD